MNNPLDEQTRTDEIISRFDGHGKRNFILKRIFIGIFGCLVLWALVTWVSYLVQKEKTILTPEQDDFVTETYRDTDGDGLYDWQEDLYGTSKRLRDSDGDGVSDADEIAGNTDPNYFGEGLDISDVAPQETVFKDYVFPEAPEEQIDITSLTTTPPAQASVDQELHTTINDLGLVVIGTYTIESQNVDLFNKLFAQDDSFDPHLLDFVVEKNKNAAQKIRTEISHSNMTLELQSLTQSLEGVALTLDLLIEGQDISQQKYSILLVNYLNAAASLQQAIVSIHKYVVAKDLVFKKDEPGNYFMFIL